MFHRLPCDFIDDTEVQSISQFPFIVMFTVIVGILKQVSERFIVWNLIVMLTVVVIKQHAALPTVLKNCSELVNLVKYSAVLIAGNPLEIITFHLVLWKIGIVTTCISNKN